VDDKPDEFYDVMSEEVLVGKAALELHLESGGHPLDIVTLEEALRDESIEIHHRAKKDRNVTKKDIQAGFSFLVSYLSQPESKARKTLNRSVLVRAGQIGVTATFSQIVNQFGGLSDLYRSSGHHNLSAKFTDVSTDAIIEQVRSKYVRDGKMPTRDSIQQESASDTGKASYRVIASRIPGGLKRLRLEEGFELPRDTSMAGIRRWGVNFRILNGELPSQNTMDFMSAVDMSVSASAVAKILGSMTEFHDLIEAEYGEWESIIEQRLSVIDRQMLSGVVPPSLRSGVIDDFHLVNRVSRYQILNRLFPQAHKKALIAPVIDDYSDKKFLKMLSRANPNIDDEVMSEICLDLGYHRDMWRLLRRDISIEEAISRNMEKSRGKLPDDKQESFNEYVDLVEDFMQVNGLQLLRPKHIKFLQNKNLLPKGDNFHAMFGKADFLKFLSSRRAEKRAEEHEILHKRLLEDISREIEKGTLPDELFLNVFISPVYEKEGAKQASDFLRRSVRAETQEYIPVKKRRFSIHKRPINEGERVFRYARWRFAKEYLTGLGFDVDPADLVVMSLINTGRSYLQTLRRYIINRGGMAEAADIESHALAMGINRYVTPPRPQYIQKLRFPGRPKRYIPEEYRDNLFDKGIGAKFRP
jgi:hypothetical protein